MQLILASSSPYRTNLLKRLNLDFTAIAPDIDESVKKGESPRELVKRLSIDKAFAIANKNPDAWIIGSDQIALFKQNIIGKPGSLEKAIIQLKSFSDSKVSFITGVALINKSLQTTHYDYSVVEVNFRKLSIEDIKNYVALDNPSDCAGSFKVESLGITLFNSVVSDDPTSLEGLPLIKLCRLLRKAGFQLP